MGDDSGLKRNFVSVLFLMGSYAFGFNFHSLVHEIGHAVAVWVQGGSMTGFFLHPFEACYNFSSYVPDHVLLYAGGAYIGGLSTVVFAIAAWKYRTPYMAPLVMTCAAGLITTSRWMIIAPFSAAFTDYTAMISLGFPGAVIAISGLLLLVTGLGVLFLFLPLFGVPAESGFLKRTALLEFGILPYQIASGVYFYVTGQGTIKGLLSINAAAALYIAAAAWLSWVVARKIRFFARIEAVRLRASHVAAVWIGFAVLMTVFLIVSKAPQ